MKKECKILMDLDRQFCKDSQKLGKDGWAKYLSVHAIMGTKSHEPYIENRNKIISLIGMVYLLDHIDFTWEPHHCFISDDNTLGVTTGTYHRTYVIEGKNLDEKGKYMTVWRKEEGDWKIVFDMGN